MNTRGLFFVLGVLVCTGLLWSSYAAAQPPGLERQGKTPPGFSEGRKVGWEGQYPPGWESRTPQEQEEWQSQLRRGRERISRSARERGFSSEEAELAADAYEAAVRRGVEPREGGRLTERGIREGKRGEELYDAVIEESERRVREGDRRDRRRTTEEALNGKNGDDPPERGRTERRSGRGR